MLKRLLSITVCISILSAIFIVPQASADDPTYWSDNAAANASAAYTGGNGSTEAPWEISTPEGLAYLAKQVNSGANQSGIYFKLTENINLSAHIWTAIGTQVGANARTFAGNLDGNGYVITNVNNGTTAVRYQGLFGRVQNSTIKNLGVTGVISGGYDVAGIAGLAIASVFESCYSEVDVTSATGGSTATANAGAGGIIGRAANGTTTVTNCYNTGNINCDVRGAGGIAGYAESTSSGIAAVSKCYNSGTVSGINLTAGVLGFPQTAATNVEKSFNMGNVYGGTMSRVILGNRAELNACGYLNTVKVNNAAPTAANGNSAAAYSAAELQTQTPYAGADWDFAKTWEFAGDNTYPTIKIFSNSGSSGTDPENIATISPETAEAQLGSNTVFSVTIRSLVDKYTEADLTWEVTGNISSNTTLDVASDKKTAVLTVGGDETAEELKVRAYFALDPDAIINEATVTVLQRSVRNISVAPSTADLWLGEAQQFTASVDAVSGASSTVTWELSGDMTAGTEISSTGLLTISVNETAAGPLTVTARSVEDPTKSGTATVNVVYPAVNGVVITPNMASVRYGLEQQFASDIQAVGFVPSGVIWKIEGNTSPATTISQTGLLKVDAHTSAGGGESAGQIKVIATSKDDAEKYGEVTVYLRMAGVNSYEVGTKFRIYANPNYDYNGNASFIDPQGNPAATAVGTSELWSVTPESLLISTNDTGKNNTPGKNEKTVAARLVQGGDGIIYKPIEGKLEGVSTNVKVRHIVGRMAKRAGANDVPNDGADSDLAAIITYRDYDGKIKKSPAYRFTGFNYHNKETEFWGVAPGTEVSIDLGTYPEVLDVNIYHMLKNAKDPSNWLESLPKHAWIDFEVTAQGGGVIPPNKEFNQGKDLYIETKIVPNSDLKLPRMHPSDYDTLFKPGGTESNTPWEPFKVVAVRNLDNQNAPVVSLGYGASFYMYPMLITGGKAEWVQAGQNPDPAKWAYYSEDTSGGLNGRNGRTEVRIPIGGKIGANNYKYEDGHTHNVHLGDAAGIEIEFIPTPGLLDGVWTEIRAIHINRNNSFEATVKYIGLDGTPQHETVQYYDTTPVNGRGGFKFYPVTGTNSVFPAGAYPNLQSVTIRGKTNQSEQAFPFVEFMVTGEDINTVPPTYLRKLWSNPEIPTKQPEPLEFTDIEFPSSAEGPLYINEVLINSKIGMNDFIEIYNSASDAMDLSGYGLSDSPAKDPFKWTFPEGTTIGAGEYLVVWARGAGTEFGLIDGELYADFGISSDGENIGLADAGGNGLDIFAVPAIKPDTSISRVPDGSGSFATTKPTPGETNNGAEILETFGAPQFSRESGFYAEPFTLELKGNGKIYYTLDGSTPSLDNLDGGRADGYLIKTDKTYVYDPDAGIEIKNITDQTNVLKSINYNSAKPIGQNDPLNKTMVVRAAVIDDDGNTSEVVSKTYFVDYDMSADFGNIMVASFATDKADLVDREYGIFPIFWQQQREFERPVHMDLFETDGTSVLNQTIGMRIRGFGTKAAEPKSFNIYARAEYGESRLSYPLFENSINYVTGEIVPEYKSVAFRRNMFDGLAQYMSGENGAEFQAQRPVAVFINGEYWGLYYMAERVSGDYIEEHYGVPAEDVYIYKNGRISEGYRQDGTLYDDSKKNVDTNTVEGFQTMSQRYDIMSALNHGIGNGFAHNGDLNSYNHVWWRSRYSDNRSGSPYEDGKWHYLMYDLDASYAGTYNAYKSFEGWGYKYVTQFAEAGMKQAAFNYTLDVFNNENSVYRQLEELVYWDDEIAINDKGKGANILLGRLGGMANSAHDMVPYLQGLFGAEGEYTHLSVTTNDFSGGKVKINYFTEHDFSVGHSYTTRNYSGHTSVVEAVPNLGYEFTGWEWSEGSYCEQDEDNGNMAFVTLSPNGTRVTAIFKKLFPDGEENIITKFEYSDGEANAAQASYGATDGDLSATVSFYNGSTAHNIGASGKTPINAPKTTWTAGGTAESSSAWEIKLSTSGYKDIYFSASQKSTGAGPADWRLAYKAQDGTFVDIENSQKRIVGVSDDTYDALQPSYQYFKLPAALDDNGEATLRVYMATSLDASGRPVSPNNGNTSINNIIFYGNPIKEGITINYDSSVRRVTVTGAAGIETAKVVLASYNGEILSDIAIICITIDEQGEGSIIIPETYTAGSDGKIRIMLLNNLGGISPLCAAKTVRL